MASIEKLYSKALNLWQSNDLNAAKDNFKKVIEKKTKKC
jgi:outer membrane protein assembly factor BamD (BamD/ComL family)